MKLNDFAGPLLAALAASAWNDSCGCTSFVAAAEDSCPGSVNDEGQCINPGAFPDMGNEESSSDDDGWLNDESSSDDEEESSSDDPSYRANVSDWLQHSPTRVGKDGYI